MKIAAIIVRLLMGFIFLFASVVVLFKLIPQPEPTGNVKIFMEGLAATGYLMTLIKVTELVCHRVSFWLFRSPGRCGDLPEHC